MNMGEVCLISLVKALSPERSGHCLPCVMPICTYVGLHFINLAHEPLFIKHFRVRIHAQIGATPPPIKQMFSCLFVHFTPHSAGLKQKTKLDTSGMRTAWPIKALKHAALLFQLFSFFCSFILMEIE